MQQLITKDWGYKILSPSCFNFHHNLIDRIGLKNIAGSLTDFKEIKFLEDGSLNIYTNSINKTIEELETFLKKTERQLKSTASYSYKIPHVNMIFLREWLLSLEGCIALILLSNCFKISPHSKNWGLLNSGTGGLYISPYTILFYDDHAKIIHPIRLGNLEIREMIEKEIAMSMKGIMQRIGQSQPGFEGLAMVSYVEYKTGLTQKEIVEIINEKSFEVMPPKSSLLLKN